MVSLAAQSGTVVVHHRARRSRRARIQLHGDRRLPRQRSRAQSRCGPRPGDRPADHRRRQSQRLRARRACAVARALEAAGATMAGGGRHRRRRRSARVRHSRADPGLRRAQRQRSRRRVRSRPDADHLEPGRGARAAGRRRAARRDAALSPEDRHRHESPRLPRTTTCAGRCRSCSPARTSTLDAVHTHFATADEPEHKLFETQRTRFEAALPRARRARRAAATAPRGQLAPRCCATRACGSTSCGRACCSTASCRRRWRRRLRAQAGDVADQPGGRGQRRARGRDASATAAGSAPTARRRWPWCRRVTRMASIAGSRITASC